MTNNFIKLKNIVSKQLGVNSEKIKLTSDFGQELGADSLDIVELILTIENDFDIEIEDQKASQIRTVKDAIQSIEESLRE